LAYICPINEQQHAMNTAAHTIEKSYFLVEAYVDGIRQVRTVGVYPGQMPDEEAFKDAPEYILSRVDILP
jgi:hypothetical protein